MLVRCLFGLLIAACALGTWFGLDALAPSAGATSLGEPAAAPANSATGAAGDAASDGGARARVGVDELIHQFGTMAVGQAGSHTFVVRNVGDGPLELGEPLATCKCTLSALASRTVPPGGTVEVTLEWKSDKAASRFREGAEIPTNDPDRRRLTLAVEGAIEPLLAVSPSLCWDLGMLNGDEPATMSGAVYSRVLESFAIRKIECSHPVFSARVRPLDESRRQQLGAKAGYAIEVTGDPQVAQGSVASRLELETDVPGAPRLHVPITAERPGPIRFLAPPGVRWNGMDQAVNLGRFAAEDGASATLFLFASDPPGEPFQITGVEADPTVDVAVTEDSGFRAPGRRRYEVTLSVPPGSPPAVRLQENCAKVRLSTNHPSAPLVKLYAEFHSCASPPRRHGSSGER